jgi:hypothetical protein
MHLIKPASPAAPSRCPICDSIQHLCPFLGPDGTHVCLDRSDDELIGAASLSHGLGHGSELDGVTHRSASALEKLLGSDASTSAGRVGAGSRELRSSRCEQSRGPHPDTFAG